MQPLAEDINGNHVIQKILQTWPSEHNQFIYDAMIAKCAAIACHKHGCCVMQKCVDAADPVQKKELMMKIADSTRVFVKNPFGNYVVQYVLELKVEDVNRRIGEKLLGSLLELGREKFSSNVIEKCLEHTTEDVKQAMVQEILNSVPSFYDLLIDQYGNYVVQKALSVAAEPSFTLFIEKLRPDVERLRNSNEFGVKIYNRLVKQYPLLGGEIRGGKFSAKKKEKSAKKPKSGKKKEKKPKMPQPMGYP